MLSARAVAVLRARAARPALARSMGHGHGAPAARFASYRHPDYTGPEAVVRYFLPHNYQLVYAVLGVYLNIAFFFAWRNQEAAKAKVAAEPKPQAPDYHSPLPAASMPDFATDEWVALMNEADGPQRWIEAAVAGAQLA